MNTVRHNQKSQYTFAEYKQLKEFYMILGRTQHSRSTKRLLDSCFACRVVFPVISLVICTAAAVKLVPELLRFKSSPELPFHDFAWQELLEVSNNLSLLTPCNRWFVRIRIPNSDFQLSCYWFSTTMKRCVNPRCNSQMKGFKGSVNTSGSLIQVSVDHENQHKPMFKNSLIIHEPNSISKHR